MSGLGHSPQTSAALAAALILLTGSRATALDWREPWSEPRDPSAAAARSDEYAWRLFVAINWPADAKRGMPDRAARLGAHQLVAWQSWPGAGEVYLDHGADPGAWSAHRPAVPLERRFETVSLKERPNLRHIVDGVMVPVRDTVADAKRLTEIRLNRSSYEFIRSHELYSVEGQLRALASGAAVSFPYGARFVKATWRPIRERDRSRYFTMQLTLADGTPRLYGLTGLHISSKELPNWFWATFEHVDNPTLPGNEGWQLPSRDRFACGNQPADCGRAPSGIGLEGTVWQHYRLRGTLMRYVDAQGVPELLANSELESGMQRSASCITCHARASVAPAGNELVPLSIFDAGSDTADDSLTRHGFVGTPDPAWFAPPSGQRGPRFQRLDFVWSMTKAQRKSPSQPGTTP